LADYYFDKAQQTTLKNLSSKLLSEQLFDSRFISKRLQEIYLKTISAAIDAV
jgi:hypothetical protein